MHILQNLSTRTLYKFIFEKEEDVTVNAAELLR